MLANQSRVPNPNPDPMAPCSELGALSVSGQVDDGTFPHICLFNESGARQLHLPTTSCTPHHTN